MSDTEKSGASEGWTVVTEDKAVAPEQNEDFERSSESSLPYSDRDSFQGDNDLEEGEEDEEEEADAGTPQSTRMPLNISLAEEDQASHLDIPSEYSLPEGEAEVEAELRPGVMDITVVGVARGGKSSLAAAMGEHLCSRGWAVVERDEEEERLQLKLEGSANVLMISSSNVRPRSLKVKNLNVCVFALPPHYTPPEAMAQMEAVMAENCYDLLLPVICKVDAMTPEELKAYREELQELMPKRPSIAVKDIYAVVCKERAYSWGYVGPTSAISQLFQLCNALESHLQVDTSERAEAAMLQLPSSDSETAEAGEEAAKGGSLKEEGGSRAAACLFALLVALVYVVIVMEAPLSFPEFARSAYSFEVLLFVLILTPLGPQKEFSVVLAIACAIFWRLAEETRQKEVDNMSMSYEKLAQENENSMYLLNSCNVQLEQCTRKMLNMSLRLYDTSDRLATALELCGSWCLDV